MPLRSPGSESGHDPDNYFASSAALLESLTQAEDPPLEAADKQRSERLSDRPSWSDRLLTPTGIGTSMLLLLGSATAGYLMLHPESLSHLQLSELRMGTSTPVPAPSGSRQSPQPVNPELPPGAPDLSQNEFVDLTLSNLGRLSLEEQPAPVASTVLPGVSTAGLPSTLPLADSSVPSAQESAAPPKRGLLSNLANAVAGTNPSVPSVLPDAPAAPSAIRMAPETPLPSVVPPAPAPAPAAQPAPPVYEAPPAAAAEPEIEPEIEPETEPSAEPTPVSELGGERNSEDYGTFVVVTPYKSDLALSQVQQLAPDAYVRNTDAGAVIQVGIHDSAETANSVVEQLQREGLSAYIE